MKRLMGFALQTLGMTRAEFWTSTPWEIHVRRDAWMRDEQDRYRLERAVAWLGAAWQRTKRLPPLHQVLFPEKRYARKLEGGEAAARRAELDSMASTMGGVKVAGE